MSTPLTMSAGLLLIFLIMPALSFQAEPMKSPLLFGLTVQGLPVSQNQILDLEAEVKVPVRLITFYLQWPAHPGQGKFPASSLQTIHSLGAVPCLTWEPMYYGPGGEQMISAQSILQGDYDPYLISFAHEAAAWRHPFILRLAHEMNIKRYHWGTRREEYGPQSPIFYRQIFRYVVSIFRQQGADNVLFAFCPNAESVPNPKYDSSAAWNTIAAYYPGDAYVQILGVDGYNWGTTQNREKHGWTSSWQSLDRIFAPAVQELRELNNHKPIIIFETGSAKHGGDRDEWLHQGLNAVQNWKIAGMCWFQVNKEVDWRISWQDIPRSGPRLRRLTSPDKDWLPYLELAGDEF